MTIATTIPTDAAVERFLSAPFRNTWRRQHPLLIGLTHHLLVLLRARLLNLLGRHQLGQRTGFADVNAVARPSRQRQRGTQQAGEEAA